MPRVKGPFKEVQLAAERARSKITAYQAAGDHRLAVHAAIAFLQAQVARVQRRDADGGAAELTKLADHLMMAASRLGGLADEPGHGRQPRVTWEDRG